MYIVVINRKVLSLPFSKKKSKYEPRVLRTICADSFLFCIAGINSMNLLLDNIIFSLQKSGGISVVWYELLRRILNDQELNAQLVDFPNDNIFRERIVISPDRIVKNQYSHFPINLQRFLNPNYPKDKGIFHSSYYRINKNPKSINITTVHDFTYENFSHGIVKAIHLAQKRRAILHSKSIICVSQNTRVDLIKLYPRINHDHIRVIYNGVNAIYQPFINKKEMDFKSLVDFSSGEFVLYVGERNDSYKNFKIAVRACMMANIPLVLVGGGFLNKREAKYLSETIGINRVKQLQAISNEQLNILYNHALCLLYPSISEGFGIPIIEAQRAGCTVISTNYTSIPEVAGKGAILLKVVTVNTLADAIQQLKKDSTLVESIREEGFINAQSFSWDKCYQQTKQLYKEVYEEYF